MGKISHRGRTSVFAFYQDAFESAFVYLIYIIGLFLQHTLTVRVLVLIEVLFFFWLIFSRLGNICYTVHIVPGWMCVCAFIILL